MRRLYSFIIILTIGIAAGTAGSFWYSRPSETMAATAVVEPSAPAKEERKILYYRNPMGAPDTSPVPKKDSMGMAYIPVYADEHQSASDCQSEPRQDPAHRGEDREGRGEADCSHRPRRRQG